MEKNTAVIESKTAELLRQLAEMSMEEIKAETMLGQLYNYYMEHIELLPPKYLQMIDDGEAAGRVMCDFISGMTDQFAINRFTEFYLPKAWQVDGF